MIYKKIALLNQTALDCLKEKDEHRIAKRFTETGIEILGADFGFAWLKSQGLKKLDLAYKSRGTPFEPTSPRKRGTTFLVLRSQNPLLINDISDSRLVKPFARQYLKSLAVIPITYKNRTYGNIYVCFKIAHKFSHEENALSTFLGNSAAQALTINRLYSHLKDFKNTLDETRDSIFMFNPKTLRIQYVNQGAVELLKYSRRQLLKKTMIDIQQTHTKEQFKSLLKPLLEKKIESLKFETVFKNAQGQTWPAEQFVQYVEAPHQQAKFLCIARDITESKKIEEERKKLVRQKDEFLSVTSHELRTPITSIKGFAQLLQMRTSEGDPEIKRFLGKINSQVDKLMRLVSDLLDVSRVEAGKLKFRQFPFDLDGILREVVEDLQLAINTHRITVKGAARRKILGDPDRIAQVLANLIRNAAKYSPEASEIVVSISANEKEVQITVQDFGMGIADEEKHKIFERFFQGHTAQTKAYPGLGLGLYISREIVRRHGGEIWVESEKGLGTSFHFTLPCLPEHQPVLLPLKKY